MRTRTFRLDKLVRDKIVANHLSEGAQVKYLSLSQTDKQKALLKKLIEEAKECLDSGELLAELADMQEIIDQLAEDEGLTKDEIAAEQKKKRDKNGGFKNGDYIETETWLATHKWAKYYAREPMRFPEVTGKQKR